MHLESYFNFAITELCVKYQSTDGSVVEFSPATREARVRFPVSAFCFFFLCFNFFFSDLFYLFIH